MIKDTIRQFSRYAKSYRKHNHIQKLAAEKTIEMAGRTRFGNIVDIGCGDGEIYRQLRIKNISFANYFGIDLSAEMLQLHPVSDNTVLLNMDFEDPVLPEYFKEKSIDAIFSSSALQWCTDPCRLFASLSEFCGNLYLSFFTEKTFEDLLSFAGASSPLCPSADILAEAKKHYTVETFEEMGFRVHFDSTREMLSYIKYSGVSGGRAVLDYRGIKRVEREYGRRVLDIEIVFVSLKKKP